MSDVMKDGALSRRSLCGSGVGAAVLALTGCGGGGGGGSDSPGSDGNSTGSINGGLTGSMYFSFIGVLKKVDLASGKPSERLGAGFTNAAGGLVTSISADVFDLSPDGKTVFFIERDYSTDANNGVYAADMASKVITKLFNLGEITYWNYISASPDGQKIAAVKYGSDNAGVYIINVSTRTDIAYYKANPDARNSVCWTPDNRLLYSNNGIYLTNPGDLKNFLRISTVFAEQMAVNPAGDKIAYSAGGDIWTMGIAGDKMQQVTTHPKTGQFNPRWSPDGKYIAFKSSFTSVVRGTISTNGTLNRVGVVPADGKLYTLETEDGVSSNAGSGTVGNLVASNGVTPLGYFDGQSYLSNMIADDMIWR